ncbi:CCA tRNA nucleotidyltransferase [Candidatus Atelocyanobacterium thalassae]|uniref:CCA-adding enzyme n=1 Tax=cyanobacterium endosymbiont of Braarudosphaera bigelowii TaxID=1285375 RepID=A0ABN6K024_9CHRO|nr:CCA tRNA nucleotidyltransferase [Candidatus Atelocyanobacterium thalassa]BDA40086.1 CCA-adding enzyme [cyanobacterium endosymbiont of Braarudosphaera bigelowii]
MRQKTVLNLSPNILPFKLDILPSTAYLVGGAVRNILLSSEQDYIDLDIILPNFVPKIAKNIAHSYHVNFIILDSKRSIIRIIFREGTIDLAKQNGNNIDKDLQQRDFTINAIAYSFHKQQIIDSSEGLRDLQLKTIRMINVKNLQDDPLRLIRAYRQASQLNFIIETKTRHAIKKLSSCISQVAVERIQTELSYLLQNFNGNDWLIEMKKDNLLRFVFSDLNQNNLCYLKQVNRKVLLLINKLKYNELKVLFGFNDIRDIYNNTLVKKVKLLCLLSQNPEIATRQLTYLKYPKNAIKILPLILEKTLLIGKEKNLQKEIYSIFLETGKNFPVFALFSLVKNINNELIFELIYRYLNPHDKLAHPHSLITGHDLITHLKIKQGQQIGKILNYIRIAYIEEKIFTKKEALDLAEKIHSTM